MKTIFFLLFLFSWITANADDFKFETIATGLDHPTALIFIDQDTALVSERNGSLRYLRSGKLDPTPIDGLPDVFVAGQAGLFDILLDVNFAQNKIIYLSFAQGTAEANTLKVARATLDDHALRNVEIIFAASPLRASAFHYGGRMIFLPDGTLLLTSGEGFEYREKAQFLDNHFGKIIRINADGSVPTDNPYLGVENALPEIYSFGHRNLQGLVLGVNQEIYSHEHGPMGGDELNLIEPTRNYGWPAVTYGVDYSGAHVTPYQTYPGMQEPIIYWVPSIAPGGMTLYNGQEFPEWQGNLLVAALAEKSVRRIVIKGTEVSLQETLFTDLDKRIRDVRQGPDGAVYLLTDSDDSEIIRVTAK